MDKTFDIGAFVLGLIYGGVLLFLVYFLLFDVKRIFGNMRTQKYVSGYPEEKDLTPGEGLIEVGPERVTFKELVRGRPYFSIPLKEISNVSIGREEEKSSSNFAKKVMDLFDEVEYLSIDFHKGDKLHTVQFASHKASPVNAEVKKEILEAKNRLVGSFSAPRS